MAGGIPRCCERCSVEQLGLPRLPTVSGTGYARTDGSGAKTFGARVVRARQIRRDQPWGRFQGEKIKTRVLILPIGRLSLVFMAWLLITETNVSTHGVAVPFLLTGYP